MMNSNDRKISVSNRVRTALEKPLTLYLDSETTGLSGDDEIIELAILGKSGATLFEERFRPNCSIHPKAQATHGITQNDLKDCPTFRYNYADLLAFLNEDFHLIIYNADFDTRLLNQSCLAHGITPFKLTNVTCAMTLYAEFWGDWNDYHGNYKWQSLENAVRQCGIEQVYDFHGAKSDALYTRLVMQYMADFGRGIIEDEIPF